MNVELTAMGDAVSQRFGPIVDFDLDNVILIKALFGGYRVFHVFGMSINFLVQAKALMLSSFPE